MLPIRRRTLVASLVAAFAVGTLLGSCAAEEQPVTPTSGDGPLIAFYGDSYTLGTGASDPTKRWSTIICQDRGWREFNPSVNGLGYVNNRADRDLPASIIAQDPDIVMVTMGLNDNFSYGRAGDGIRDAMNADLDRLVAALPDARFIVVEPFWYTDARPDSVQIIIDWSREAADRIGADWIPDASHWIEGHPEWMAADGLHPNDDGYAEMARRMDAALADLGL